MMRKYRTVLILGVILLVSGAYLLWERCSVVNAPGESPIITTNARYDFGGESLTLNVYRNGNITYIEETNLRLRIPPNSKTTRIRKTGKIQQEDLNSLLRLFESEEFKKLADRNTFLGIQQADGSLGFGDMYFTVTIDYEDIHRTVRADRYISTDGEKTYPDMPYPVNEIYSMAKQIIDNLG